MCTASAMLLAALQALRPDLAMFAYTSRFLHGGRNVATGGLPRSNRVWMAFVRDNDVMFDLVADWDL